MYLSCVRSEFVSIFLQEDTSTLRGACSYPWLESWELVKGSLFRRLKHALAHILKRDVWYTTGWECLKWRGSLGDKVEESLDPCTVCWSSSPIRRSNAQLQQVSLLSGYVSESRGSFIQSSGEQHVWEARRLSRSDCWGASCMTLYGMDGCHNAMAE